MLDATIKGQLKAYLEKLQRPIELVATLDDSVAAGEMRSLLADIAELSERVGHFWIVSPAPCFRHDQ